MAYALVETASAYVHRGPSGGRFPKLYLSALILMVHQRPSAPRGPTTAPPWRCRTGPGRVSDQASSRRGDRGLSLGAKFARLSLLEAEESAIQETGTSARTFAAYGPLPYAADPDSWGAVQEDDVAYALVETASAYVPREPSNWHSTELCFSRSGWIA